MPSPRAISLAERLPTIGIPWRPAVTTALGTTAVSVVVSFAALWLTLGADDGWLALLRRAVRAHLVAIGGTLTVSAEAGDLTLTMLPIGATLLVGAVAALFARRAVPASVPDMGAFAAMAGGVAAAAAAIASAASNTSSAGTEVIRSTFGAFLVVGLGALLGAASRFDDVVWISQQRREFRVIARSALMAVGWVLAGSTLVLAVALVAGVEQAGELWTSLDPDPGGALVLGVVCVLALPTLVLWVTAVMFGPGFWIGAESHVSLGGADLGLVPGVPVLAALPGPGAFHWWGYAIAAVPLAAALAAGWKCVEADQPLRDDLLRRVGLGLVAGAAAGAIVGMLTMTSRGSLGPGLLQTAGPQAWSIPVIAVGVMAVGGALGAMAAHYRGQRAQPDLED